SVFNAPFALRRTLGVRAHAKLPRWDARPHRTEARACRAWEKRWAAAQTGMWVLKLRGTRAVLDHRAWEAICRVARGWVRPMASPWWLRPAGAQAGAQA